MKAFRGERGSGARGWSFLALTGLLVHCSSTSGGSGVTDAGPEGDGSGVNAYCEARAQWTMATGSLCTTCIGLALNPVCTCNKDPSAGQCLSQQQAMNSDPDCTMALSHCVGMCQMTDCACIDACYVGHDHCKVLAGAADDCVISACAAACK